MFKKTTSSIACLTIMATSIGALNANASEQTEGSQKERWGMDIKISKNHPNEQSNATSNRSTFSTKSKSNHNTKWRSCVRYFRMARKLNGFAS